jgi:hypothetical protein
MSSWWTIFRILAYTDTRLKWSKILNLSYCALYNRIPKLSVILDLKAQYNSEEGEKTELLYGVENAGCSLENKLLNNNLQKIGIIGN